MRVYDDKKLPENEVLVVQMKTDNKISAKNVASLIYLECLYPEGLESSGFEQSTLSQESEPQAQLRTQEPQFESFIEEKFQSWFVSTKKCKYSERRNLTLNPANPGVLEAAFTSTTRLDLEESIRAFLSGSFGVNLSSSCIFQETKCSKQEFTFSYEIRSTRRDPGRPKLQLIQMSISGPDRKTAEKCGFFRIVKDLCPDL